MPGTLSHPICIRRHAVDTAQLTCVHESTGRLFQEAVARPTHMKGHLLLHCPRLDMLVLA